MTGFTDDSSVWEINWSGFFPTHRQSPNRPYFIRSGYNTQTEIPGFGRFIWETIDQAIMGSSGGISYASADGKMPFYLDVYGSYGAPVTSSLFWDENSNQSVGIFINNAARWNDQLYPIWNISGKLSVGFFYKDNQMQWKYPLVNGTRNSSISCYDHDNDNIYMNELEKLFQPQKHPSGFAYRARMSQLSYNHFLQNRYGTIHLDRIKDWVLTYPDSLPLGPVIFKECASLK